MEVKEKSGEKDPSTYDEMLSQAFAEREQQVTFRGAITKTFFYRQIEETLCCKRSESIGTFVPFPLRLYNRHAPIAHRIPVLPTESGEARPRPREREEEEEAEEEEALPAAEAGVEALAKQLVDEPPLPPPPPPEDPLEGGVEDDSPITEKLPLLSSIRLLDEGENA